ncbi:hypothetical protein NVP1173O_53 [Vibrio phage 1.173.O._10N.261.55.A11]|nr:hypothetical protein NVP1173O_53 [Vibrio phage 1.173.O._10N.261.55.A11]
MEKTNKSNPNACIDIAEIFSVTQKENDKKNTTRDINGWDELWSVVSTPAANDDDFHNF